jgi:nucleoside-diphosphate-sugar epimerase
MSRILITGGAGFIGGHLAQSLSEQGHEVHLVDNLARGRQDRFLTELLAGGRVQLHERSLTEPGALADLPDDYGQIYHFAAILGVQNVLDRPYATLRDNVALLESAIELARRQRSLERFVFASTSEVYAGSLQHMELPFPTPESVPIALPGLDQPRTSYMLSKLYGEAMVQHAGLPFTIVRPHNFYGPRMGLAHVVPQLLEKAYRAEPDSEIEVFSVDHRRTFCFIDDAVAMISAAAAKPECAGRTLNIGTEEPEVTIGELAELIIRVVGKPLSIAAAPTTPGSPSRRCPDMSLTSELTGLRATTSVEDGVRQTYDWYRPTVFEDSGDDVAR